MSHEFEVEEEGLVNLAIGKANKVEFELDEEIFDTEDTEVDSDEEVVAEKDADDFVPDMQPITMVDTADDLNMTSDELRQNVIKARDNIENSYKELCHYLHSVQRKEHWKSWGFASFKEYIAREIVFKKSKAFRLIQLWENLYVKQSDKTIFSRMVGQIGWTKAGVLMFIINSENVDEWIEKASHLNVEDLEAEVKRYLKSLKPSDPEATGDALDMGSKIENSIESTQPQKFQLEFVDYQDYMALMQAIEMMKEMEPTFSNSQSVANICREFMSSAPGGEDRKQMVLDTLVRYESQFGLKLVIIDGDDVVHGFDFLKELAKKGA